MTSLNFNKKAAKTRAVESYDVHIYFQGEENRAAAKALVEAIKAAVPSADGPHDVKPGWGPHLVPNVEVSIPPAALSKVLTFLQLNQSEGVSTLVHPHTGDEVIDHTQLVNWVGKPVPLNLDALLPPSQRKNNVTKFSAPKAA